MKEREFFFSVILSVYNVAPYIREAMDSLISQDYGFENIQIIMVDDGSTDGSGSICDEYAQKYPDNTLVIHKENGGLSSARNAGMKAVCGKWISFFDPDDYLDHDTFSKVYSFLQQHPEETDVVAIPLFMFGDQNGPHPLNNKFENGSRIIDLEKEWTLGQMSLASAFVRREIANQHAFKEDLQLVVAEDVKELIKILTVKRTLGVVNGVKYHYRKRADSNVGSAKMKKGWYTEYLNNLCKWAIDFCNDQYGIVPRFVQFLLMHDLQWKLTQYDVPQGILTEEEACEYKKRMWEVISEIDDDVIMIQKHNYTEQKMMALSHKYGRELEACRFKDSLLLGYEKCFYFDLSKIAFHLTGIKQGRDMLTIEGWYPRFPAAQKYMNYVSVILNGTITNIVSFPYEQDRKIVGETGYIKKYFRVILPLKIGITKYTISFAWKTSMGTIPVSNLVLDTYFPISNTYRSSYFYKNGWLLQSAKNCLVLTAKKHCSISFEIAFLKEIWNRKAKGARKAVISRCLYHIMKAFPHKPIWLIADKADRAGDNGEAFFKYCVAKGSKHIRYKFLISKNSSDYERMKKSGEVIPYMSMRHKLNFLLADYIISAYSHGELNNPFFEYNAPYRDIMQNCKYIFLQHGVTEKDVSAQLNYFTKNITGFVTAARPEYESVAAGYGYPQGSVWLTGFPRYDFLQNNEEKSIVVMPTWRRELFGAYHAEDSRYDLLPGFENSSYYRFYLALMNHPRMLQRAKDLGYKVCFVPHPTFFPYIDRFTLPDQVTLYGHNAVYRELFSKNMLLVTDFSSVAFDFSYLRKPIIYCQFEKLNHYQPGYFSYEDNGFGEVTRDVEETANCIIEYMENNCKLKDKYKERIDSFFAFNDRKNCERIYNMLIQRDDTNE